MAGESGGDGLACVWAAGNGQQRCGLHEPTADPPPTALFCTQLRLDNEFPRLVLEVAVLGLLHQQ